MADMMSLLVDILKISSTHVNEYANQGAINQLFFLFIFPTVFIIVFIYILSYRVMPHHKGLRLIIAVVVYAFIIISGYYNWFVFLSSYWLLGLVLIGFLYLLLGRGGGGEGGGGGAKRLTGKAKSYLGLIKTATVGDRSINPLEIIADKKLFDQKIAEMDAEIKKAEEEKKNTPKEQQGIISDSIARMKAEKREMEHRRKEHLRLRKAAA